MLSVLQCTAKQMAHFILETDPFLSTGILVSKEELKWNHFSKSCMEIVKLIYHIYGWFAYKKKEENYKRGMLLAVSPTFVLQHMGFSWGCAFPDFLQTNLWGLVSTKPQAVWSQIYHLCVIPVASALQFTWGSHLSNFVTKMVLFPIQTAFQARPHPPGHCRKVASIVWYQYNSVYTESLNQLWVRRHHCFTLQKEEKF